MIRYLFVFFSLVKGCYLDINKNNIIKNNCFIEINKNNYVLELPVKKNNIINFKWFNLKTNINLKFSWYNTTKTYLIPHQYNIYYNTGSIKIPSYKNKKDLYHCDNILCNKYSNETKSGNIFIYINSNKNIFSGFLYFILEVNNNYIKNNQLNTLKNIWYKCCYSNYIYIPPITYNRDKNTYCSWIPTPWGTWNNTENKCENIYNIDCDSDGNIQYLFLSNNGLKCNLSEIKELKHLKLIDLSYNYIYTDIKIFNKINKIEDLNLQYNFFYGDINNLNLPNISKLNLKFNNLYGNVDLFIKKYKNLKIFDISYNSFRDQILPKFNKDIEYINIGRNKFYGYLDSIKEYKKLKFLDISFNNFYQEIDISCLKILDVLIIRNNYFKKFFILPKKIKYFDTSYNLIDDTIDKIKNFNKSYIDISNNNIKITFNDNLKSIITNNTLILKNNYIECINNSINYPYWVYYYYPTIEKCKKKNIENNNIKKNYFFYFLFTLLLFIIYILLTIGIYFYNRYKNNSVSSNIQNLENENFI